ncbi:MAG: hypothetical protein A3C36_01995 [Omnitrophica WOR_2 bacterium RIFCSPHIGHO2_02_FULL_52_10]|nr:MAG: hypothetical protein A3C36_01995 [Omnitrophica WOR_2 bacterium RIFCSPHIGHO2_02_FULL_52_10]
MFCVKGLREIFLIYRLRRLSRDANVILATELFISFQEYEDDVAFFVNKTNGAGLCLAQIESETLPETKTCVIFRAGK